MITEPIRQLIAALPYVLVTTADATGQPHVAIGEQVIISGDSLLVFENWFCPATLQNIACNPYVSVVAFMADTGKGYQMLGSVIWGAGTAGLNGDAPSFFMSETPLVLTRFTVRVESVFEFTSGIHSDLPMVA